MKPRALIVSCEHAVNTVPAAFISLFAPYEELLQTHQGYDLGALPLAQYLSQHFCCEMMVGSVTRLLIDLNRSLSHRACFSFISTSLSEEKQKQIIHAYYLPYRLGVEHSINQHIAQNRQVLHLSIHSFTPVLNQQPRTTDIGLLFDPKREQEKKLVQLWKLGLKEQNPKLRVRLNYPYLGKSDGFTTYLRKKYTEQDYLGIEMEMNQDYAKDKTSLWQLGQALALTLPENVNTVIL